MITLNGTLYELTHVTQAGNYLMLTLVPFVGSAIIITLPVLAVENVDSYNAQRIHAWGSASEQHHQHRFKV